MKKKSLEFGWLDRLDEENVVRVEENHDDKYEDKLKDNE